jgi:plasmid stability protein
MASITIRDLDDQTKERLRRRAASRGHSMEEEARRLIREGLARRHAGGNLAQAIAVRLAACGGVELELAAREPIRDPPGIRR